MKKVELLAPVGSLSKLHTALHFGADACYLAGKNFGLRAYATNFEINEIEEAVKIAHSTNRKIYVTVNIFASNADFILLYDYLKELHRIGVDALIVSDAGIIAFIKKHFESFEIHLSTQANTTNKYAVAFWRDIGVKRVVLARELDLDNIKEISDYVGDSVELEAFIHGAMCISYSGRCLLSTYLSSRDSNRGECVQACRWEYNLSEVSRKDKALTISEDERGTYILNSKDMNTMPIIDKIIDAGITSLKIEGRMKSEYYVGTVINAYRRRLDDIYLGKPYDISLEKELLTVNHREYTTGFYLGQAEQCYYTSKPDNDYAFVAEVIDYDEETKMLKVRQRNRFFAGDTLEVVSTEGIKTIVATDIFDEQLRKVVDCKLVMQLLYIKTDKALKKYDMLRKKTMQGE